MKNFLKQLGTKLARSRPPLQKYYNYLLTTSLHGMNIGGGAVCGGSGEDWVLEYIKNKTKEKDDIIIFDVGANKGEYAQLCQKIMGQKKCQVYCFEPSKETFKILNQNLASTQCVKTFNIGLGEKPETRILYSDQKGSGLASLYDRNLEHHPKVGRLDMKENVEIETVDNFCKKENLNQIDLLKLDVEGNELSCLKGAENMLEGRINFIQFEFGGCNIDSRTYFQDFFYLLSPRYKIYRILGKGLFEIKQYSEINEIFLTTNYLAERNDNN